MVPSMTEHFHLSLEKRHDKHSSQPRALIKSNKIDVIIKNSFSRYQIRITRKRAGGWENKNETKTQILVVHWSLKRDIFDLKIGFRIFCLC